MGILRFYKSPGLLSGQLSNKLTAVTQQCNLVTGIETELCYYVDTKRSLSETEIEILKWTLSSPLESQGLRETSFLDLERNDIGSVIIEIGPRFVNHG